MTPGGPQETSTPMPCHQMSVRRKESPTKTLFSDEETQKTLEKTKDKLDDIEQEFIEYRSEKDANEK